MRTKRQKIEKQGNLTPREKVLASMFKHGLKQYFTTLHICRITKKVSGRDVVRKLQASGVPIGPAVLLRTNENGSRVYGWRIK